MLALVMHLLSALCGCCVKLQEPGSHSENSRHVEAVSMQQVLLVLGELVNQQEMPCTQSQLRRNSTIRFSEENFL